MAVILVFFCLLENEPLLPRLRENILLNVEFKNEVKRANLQVNKRILKWRPFWNNVCNQGRGKGYQPKRKAEADNPYRDLDCIIIIICHSSKAVVWQFLFKFYLFISFCC